MKNRIIVSIILGTFLLFIWNALSWMVLPFHSNSLSNIPDSAIDMSHLQNTLLKDGVYHYPGLPDTSSPESLDKIESKLKAGPRITLMVYKKGSTNFFEPSQFLWSGVINLLTVITLLFTLIKTKHHQLKPILIFCMLIALLLILINDFGQMNWHLFPLDYTLANVVDRLVSFGLLGLLFGLYTFKNYQHGG